MKSGRLTEIIQNKNKPAEAKRNYIGASAIGASCWRQIWYEFNDYESKSLDPRIQRIFEFGHAIEALVKTWLKEGGLEFKENIPSCSDAQLPYFKGNIDALTPFYIIEIKSINRATFAQVVTKGVKQVIPKYYAQMQAYMGMTGYEQTVLLMVNKDTCDLHEETVDFDKSFYGDLRVKAQAIYEAKTVPPRIACTPAWFECKQCKFREVCWK